MNNNQRAENMYYKIFFFNIRILINDESIGVNMFSIPIVVLHYFTKVLLKDKKLIYIYSIKDVSTLLISIVKITSRSANKFHSFPALRS